MPARLIVAHGLAFIFIVTLGAFIGELGARFELQILVGVMLAAWTVIAVYVVRPLVVMAADVGDYSAGDATATRTAIATAHEEQARLAREIHHRVKNNLQVINSLISIQARSAASLDVARAYAAIQIRVGALALVHRWLFEDNAGQGVDFGALAHDLCGSLQQGVAAAFGVELAIATRIERLYISQDAAVPLAFLITEIIAAAGAANSKSPFEVVLTVISEPGGGRLTIASSIFASAERLDQPGSSAPSRIVNGMVRQLRGTLAFDADDSAYAVGFPLA